MAILASGYSTTTQQIDRGCQQVQIQYSLSTGTERCNTLYGIDGQVI
jgi:hypothetical protein